MVEKTEINQNKKQRLGRGLGSLLGGNVEESVEVDAKLEKEVRTVAGQAPIVQSQPDEGMRIWNVSIEKIIPVKNQPRQHFDSESLQELANSIRQQGIMQPITVRRKGELEYEIVAGERRWRAAQLAGLTEVPVIIKKMDNQKMLEMAILENIQREDLNPIEEAISYNRLVLEFGLTQAQVAEKVGKERATVANSLRLLSLSSEIRTHIINGTISQGHAKVLLSVADQPTQNELAQSVIKNQLSVRALEKLVSSISLGMKSNRKQTEPAKEGMASSLDAIQNSLQQKYGTKVGLDYKDGRGKLAFYFHSQEEFDSLIETLIEAKR